MTPGEVRQLKQGDVFIDNEDGSEWVVDHFNHLLYEWQCYAKDNPASLDGFTPRYLIMRCELCEGTNP